MPTYEYECGKCGVFEVSQRISDPALSKCPTCRRKVQRLISASSFAFKGSGWYVTDYARKGGGSPSSEGDGSSSSESKSDSGSSDTKTETKSESKSTGKEKKAKASSSSSEKSSS